MAIYHLSVKTISRSAGRSATAAAAYRSGEKIMDERTGEIHDYTRKGGVEYTELITPANAPEWAANRSAVWNAAEQSETRKNSTVAREFVIALPSELDEEQRKKLAIDFTRELVERHRCVADVAIHAPSRKGDDRNHHAHILISTRRLEANGFTEKTRELDEKKSGEVDRWRERYAEVQNERLKEAGISQTVDHRSLKSQGITDREPTKHIGVAATEYERRTGKISRRREDQNAISDALLKAKNIGEAESQINKVIINLDSNLKAALLELEKEKNREKYQAEQQQKQQAAAAKIDAMTSKDIAKIIETMRPAKASDLASQDAAVKAAEELTKRYEAEKKQAQEMEAKAIREAQKWRVENPLKTKMHDTGIYTAKQLDEYAALEARGRIAAQNADIQGAEARRVAQNERDKAESRYKIQNAPTVEKIQKLEAIKKQKEAQESEVRRKEQQEAQRQQQQQRVTEQFKKLADNRAAKNGGFEDGGKHWQTLPDPLKKLVDVYNATPERTRAAVIAEVVKNDEGRAKLASVLNKHQEQQQPKKKDRGFER